MVVTFYLFFMFLMVLMYSIEGDPLLGCSDVPRTYVPCIIYSGLPFRNHGILVSGRPATRATLMPSPRVDAVDMLILLCVMKFVLDKHPAILQTSSARYTHETIGTHSL
ncbi:unnamed protein product [Ectocarpus sp. 12 AP-2014]